MTKIHRAERAGAKIITGHFVTLLNKAGASIGALEVFDTDDPGGIADQVVAAINAKESREGDQS